MKRVAWILSAVLLSARASESPSCRPAARKPPPAATVLDRVVVRWHAPETGGPAKPQFVFERELAFEARLESLADPDPELGPYHDRHVRAALDRHIAETLLATLPIVPPLEPRVVARRAETARGILEERVHGRPRLIEAAAAEGVGSDELDALLRRKARASLYLEKMMAPMLEPSDAELQTLWRTGSTPFKDQPFDQVKAPLSRWYVGQRLAHETEAYFQNARSRVTVSISRRARRSPRRPQRPVPRPLGCPGLRARRWKGPRGASRKRAPAPPLSGTASSAGGLSVRSDGPGAGRGPVSCGKKAA